MGILNSNMSYWQAEAGNEPLIDATIGDLLDQRAADYPTKEAIVYSCYPELGEALNIRWTYQEFHTRVNIVAKGLLALGMKKGEHIAVWATNVPEWLVVYMAAAKVGLVIITINPALRAAEVEYILRQGDICALFFMERVRDYDCLEMIRALTTPGKQNGEVSSEQLPLLRFICLLRNAVKPVETGGWRPLRLQEMISTGDGVSDEALSDKQATVTPSDPVVIMYTSGTTGFPKGAILNHRSMSNQSLLVMHRGSFDVNERVCITVPFFHILGNAIVVGTLCSGATLCPLLSFDAVKVMQVISQERCTRIAFVPTMLLAILQHPRLNEYDLTSLRYIASTGAPVPVALMEQVKERIGAKLSVSFGQTESTGPITTPQYDDSLEMQASTVGRPMPYMEVKVIDPETGEVVPCGKRGEICCRGFQVMLGYYKMLEKTAETIDADGWLHTGDLATMDEHGYVNIVGRLKEMVIRGGENIYPNEIEEFLRRHPKVAEVYVLGVPDAFFGEVLLAVVRPKADERLTEEELRAFCKDQISHQKLPRYFQFVDSYPMTGSGKVQKYVLRERAIKVLGLEDIARTKTA